MTDGASPREPLVAVVTPFYNTDEYLRECIESVLAQSYESWRYILYDNCSTDDSLAIAREYERRDERIEVIEAEEFVGQLANFNRSLEQVPAEADYVKMVFADDLLLERCLEEMVELAESDPEIRVVSSYAKIERELYLDGLPLDVEVLTGEDAFRRTVYGGMNLLGSPTSVLYRADAVRQSNEFFPEDVKFADIDAGFEVLEGGKLGFVHQVLSYYRMDEEALTPRLQDFRPGCLGMYLLTAEHAHRYLPDDEAKDVIQRHRSDYYADLGEEVLRLRGRDFWRFHREALGGIDEDIDMGLLAAHAAMAAFREVLLAPYRAIRFLRDRIVKSRFPTRPGR